MYIYIIFLRTHFKIYRDSYTFIPNVIEFDHIQGTYCQVGKDYIRFLFWNYVMIFLCLKL